MQLATIGRGVSFWDLRTRKKRFKVSPLPCLSHGCFSPNGASFAVKNTAGRIVVLDPVSGYESCVFKNPHDIEGSNILFSTCGRYLVDGSWDGDILVKDVELGVVEFKASFADDMICSIQHCPSSDTWIFQHSRKARDAHNPPPPDYFTEWSWPFQQGGFKVLGPSESFIRASAISPDGLLVAMTHGARPGQLSVRRIADGTELLNIAVELGGSGNHVVWCPRAKHIGCVMKGKIVIIDFLAKEIIAEFPIDYPSYVAFAPTGGQIALGSWSAGRLVDFGVD